MDQTKYSVNKDPLAVAFKNGQLFVRITSLFTLASGLLLLIQPLLRHSSPRIERYLIPTNAIPSADFATLILGLLLIYLAYELAQRKRVAWLIALGVSLASLVYEAYLDTSVLHYIFPVFVIIVLVIGQRQFVLKTSHASNFKQGFSTLGISIAIAILYGTIGFWLLDKRDFGVTFTLSEAFKDTVRQYLLIGDPDLLAHTRYSKWFLDSLSVVGSATFIYGLYSILRPLRYEYRTLPAEREHAQRLLEIHGGEIDDYFKLWPQDKSYFFSSDGAAFIAYAVSRGVAICLANPEGNPESIPQLISDFRDFCTENGWLIAFIAASEKHKTKFEAAGFNSIIIGADAVVNINNFINETSRNKYFRNITNRFANGNFTATRHSPPHSSDLINELRLVSDDWLAIPGHKQWTFITGYFSSRYFEQTPLFVIRNDHGQALAFANELPSFKKGEATIDLMRHKRDAPKNVMDYLFIKLVERLHEEGIERFNLGLSPLARQEFTDSFNEKLLDYIYLVTQRFVSTKGLHQYKSKFDPLWEPRYVYYLGNTPSLAQIGLALSKLSIYK